MKYKITHSAALVGEFEYEASSGEEALALFKRDWSDAKIGLADMKLIDTSDIIQKI